MTLVFIIYVYVCVFTTKICHIQPATKIYIYSITVSLKESYIRGKVNQQWWDKKIVLLLFISFSLKSKVQQIEQRNAMQGWILNNLVYSSFITLQNFCHFTAILQFLICSGVYNILVFSFFSFLKVQMYWFAVYMYTF